MANFAMKLEPIHINMSPTGFIIYAEDFLNSFKAYDSEQPFSPAKYYLVCRSIELAFKSFLLIEKVTIKEIKFNLGHDLSKILNKANNLGINKIVEITGEEEIEIKKANNWYNRKGFEYFDIKNIIERKDTLPDLTILHNLALRLIKILMPICLSQA